MSSERDRQREQTRQRLYEASLAVFRADGVAAARIDDIAQSAGVSRGTFYFHFPSKEDVLLQMIRESQTAMIARLDDLGPDATLERALRQVAADLALQWQDDAPMLAEIGMVALKRAAQNLPEIEGSHPIQEALVPWFERAAARGETADMLPPSLLSEFFLVNLFGAALAWCGNPVVPLDDLMGNTVTFFLRAAAPD